MSGVLGSDWRSDLRPASFRGVSFLYDAHQRVGGRRVVSYEFPLRESGWADDLGRRTPTYRLTAYVLAANGASYFDARDQLQAAFDAPGVGTLVHPWLGSFSVLCATCTLSETGDRGGEASWDLEFVQCGTGPSPAAAPDTASSLLGGIGSLLSLAVQVYTIGALIVSRPGILLGIAESYLGGLAGSLLGVSPAVLQSIAGLVAGLAGSANVSAIGGVVPPVTSSITGASGDPVAVAVTDIFAAAAAAVLATTPIATSDPVLGVTGSVTLSTDPSAGLAALAAWMPPTASGSGLAAVTQATLRQQFTDLVQGAAVAAVIQVYANLTWTSANAAAAARTQVLALLDARIQAAAAADDDAMLSAWLGMVGLVTADLAQRVQNLPNLVPYATLRSLPAPVLAQLLYGDGSRGDEMAAFNDALHPGFMPLSGLALTT